jgi:hypothetical protein
VLAPAGEGCRKQQPYTDGRRPCLLTNPTGMDACRYGSSSTIMRKIYARAIASKAALFSSGVPIVMRT